MKIIFIAVIFMIVSLNGIAQFKEIPKKEIPEDYGYVVKIGQQIPDFEFDLANGKHVKTSDLKGKVVMMQFTASWCSVCREEMPHIESEIQQRHKDNPDFALFGIDLDEPKPTVKKFEEEMKISYPLALDPKGKIFYTFAQQGAGVTRNVITNKSGKIVYMTRLYNEEEFREMVKVIDFLLK